MTNAIDEAKKYLPMGETEQNVRYAVGSAAAATAIYAPVGYAWKGVLTAIAAASILSAVFGVSPAKRLWNSCCG